MATTLLELCQRTASRLDDLKVYGVTGATATTVATPQLVNQYAGTSTGIYDGAWVYNDDQQMRVVVGGYAPSTGTLTVFPGWSVAPVPGDEFSVTHLFPIGRSATQGEDTPYQAHVGAALAHLAYPDILELPLTASDRYPLAAYRHWLDRPERLLGIREPAPLVGRLPVDAAWRGPEIERQGAALALRLRAPFAAGTPGVLTLDVLRPAWTLVDGAESTTGPLADAQAVEADPEDVVAGALAFAYLALAARQASSPDGADWAAKYADQRDRFAALAAYDRTRALPAAPSAAGREAA